MSPIFIVLAVIVVLGLYAMSIYNRFVKLKNQVEEAYSGIEVQLKRRYDLIPNLVNTVKGYARQEQETLERVVELRNTAIQMPRDKVEGQARAENALSQGIQSIMLLSEDYPDLKSNQNFLSLQDTLSEVEDGIEKSRRYYNALVRDNNTYVESLPSAIIARAANFVTYPFFDIDEKERENVEVKF